MCIDAARADLAHQVHAHCVAAEREEGAVAEREDAAIAPDEVEGEGEQRVAQVLAPQCHRGGAEMECRSRRHGEVQDGNDDDGRRQQRQEDDAAMVGGFDEASRDHASTARPLSANNPRGRF